MKKRKRKIENFLMEEMEEEMIKECEGGKEFKGKKKEGD